MTGLRAPTTELPCPNPFCDGYGDIDVSPGITGRSRAPGACEVGPHPRRQMDAFDGFVRGVDMALKQPPSDNDQHQER